MTTNGREIRWRLYVDESGKFDSLDDEVLALGLLVRTDVSATEGANLRRSLQTAAPELPWPLHAAELNVPVYHALAAYAGRSGSGGGAAKGEDDLPDRVVAILRTGFERELETALSSVRAGQKPEGKALKALDQALRRASRRIYEEVQSRSRKALASVFRVMESLARAGNDAPDAPAVMIVLAGESSRGDASPGVDPAVDRGSERYLTVLECLLERTGDVVARRGGRHNVILEVLSRPSFNQARHLGNVSRRVQAGVAAPVRLTAMQPLRFDAQVSGALVLADAAANRARRSLVDAPNASLLDFEDSLQKGLSAPVRGGSPPLSNLAATGRARFHVQEARHGRSSDPALLEREVRRWAKEQALEWGKYFGGRHA